MLGFSLAGSQLPQPKAETMVSDLRCPNVKWGTRLAVFRRFPAYSSESSAKTPQTARKYREQAAYEVALIEDLTLARWLVIVPEAGRRHNEFNCNLRLAHEAGAKTGDSTE